MQEDARQAVLLNSELTARPGGSCMMAPSLAARSLLPIWRHQVLMLAPRDPGRRQFYPSSQQGFHRSDQLIDFRRCIVVREADPKDAVLLVQAQVARDFVGVVMT